MPSPRKVSPSPSLSASTSFLNERSMEVSAVNDRRQANKWRGLVPSTVTASRRRRRARLAQGMGAGEGIERGAGVDNAGHGRKRREVDREELRPGGVAGEADVGHGDGIAVTIASSRRAAGQMSLEYQQGLRAPVPAPQRAARLVDVELALQIFA